MGRKKPWCERAESRQAIETITEKHAWNLAPRTYWGGVVQLLVFSGFVSLHAALVIAYVMIFAFDDDPYAPGFLEATGPVWVKTIAILLVIFLLSLLLTLPGKRSMKQLLIPTRCHRCPKCFYDLSNRPRGEDLCPECGVVAPRRECVRLWCKLLRTRF